MEYIVLGLGAVFVILLAVVIRMFVKDQAPKGNAGAKEIYFQDGKEMIPQEDGEVWRDDGLYNLKEGKEQGPYMGNKKAKNRRRPTGKLGQLLSGPQPLGPFTHIGGWCMPSLSRNEASSSGRSSSLAHIPTGSTTATGRDKKQDFGGMTRIREARFVGRRKVSSRDTP